MVNIERLCSYRNIGDEQYITIFDLAIYTKLNHEYIETEGLYTLVCTHAQFRLEDEVLLEFIYDE